MKKIFKCLSVLMLPLIFTSPLCAADAVVTYVNGKVEVNRNNEWIGLKAGDAVHEGETISTGFQSDAKIKYNGSLLSLSALTRVTLEELASTKSGDSVNVYLNTGAVRSKVTHVGNERVQYTVRSPVAVASVRGTDFTMYSNGFVKTHEGAVAVYPARYYVPSVRLSDEEVAEEAIEEIAEEAAENTETTAEAAGTESSVSQENSATTENTVAASEIPSENANNAENTASESSSTEKESTYVPATATTKASDINSNTPAGAVVVGKNQTTEVSSSGSVKSTASMASSGMEKAKNSVTTASEKEAVSSSSASQSSSSSTASASSSTSGSSGSSNNSGNTKTKGKVTVTVSFN